jgi:hypothetical protein
LPARPSARRVSTAPSMCSWKAEVLPNPGALRRVSGAHVVSKPRSHVELEVVVGVRIGHVEETTARGGLLPHGEVIRVVVREVEELEAELLVDPRDECSGTGRRTAVVPSNGGFAAASLLERLDAFSDMVLLLAPRHLLADPSVSAESY